MNLEPWLLTAGGKIRCHRCQAIGKRNRHQCGAPASIGKTVCRFHGGKSTGPRTEAGRQRCALAKTVHGYETRKARAERRKASIHLAALESIGMMLGFMSGPKTRGRKPGVKNG